jgi:hypothetical protein
MSNAPRITELDQCQQEQLAIYRDKWIRLALATETYELSDERLTELVAEVYRAGNLPPPERVERVRSPNELQRRTNELLGTTGKFYTPCYGSHDSSWLSFYDYMRQVVGLTAETEKLVPLLELSQHVGWFMPLSDICVVSERPIHISLDSEGRLHAEGGAALAYSDNYRVYALHGVRFEGDLTKFVTTPVEQLDMSEIMNIRNAEQRAAVIRRVGVTRMFSHLPSKELDRRTDYRLLEVEVGASFRIYLQMINPSVEGHVHIEAVHPDCRTVEQALSWRNFGSVTLPWSAPQVLT